MPAQGCSVALSMFFCVWWVPNSSQPTRKASSSWSTSLMATEKRPWSILHLRLSGLIHLVRIPSETVTMIPKGTMTIWAARNFDGSREIHANSSTAGSKPYTFPLALPRGWGAVSCPVRECSECMSVVCVDTWTLGLMSM